MQASLFNCLASRTWLGAGNIDGVHMRAVACQHTAEPSYGRVTSVVGQR